LGPGIVGQRLTNDIGGSVLRQVHAYYQRELRARYGFVEDVGPTDGLAVSRTEEAHVSPYHMDHTFGNSTMRLTRLRASFPGSLRGVALRDRRLYSLCAASFWSAYMRKSCVTLQPARGDGCGGDIVLARQFQVSGTAKSDGRVERLDQLTTDHILTSSTLTLSS
jgi:hypothetical protein